MEWVERLLAGDRRALARTLSLVEDDGPEARAALAALYPRTGRAHIVGVTGAPGTGKSTLVNELAKLYRARGLTVGIIAVDPTSPFSGGALLGDRVRMRDLAGDPGVFIRSMATRGSLGGLARATGDAILVLDAAGFARILVETVGVGQAEVDIASAAHTTVVVEAPGLGDEVQAIKAGVLEIADVFAVNKADREGAERTVLALQMMLGTGTRPTGHHGASPTRQREGSALAESGADEPWQPPICKTVALRGEGVPALLDAIEAHATYLRASGRLHERERLRVRSELEQILQQGFLRRLQEDLPAATWHDMIQKVMRRETDPYAAAGALYRMAVAARNG
jgi:LAO/AO transport system kinase